jgi:hypothetical protein
MSTATATEIGQRLFEEEVHLTDIVEYGVSWSKLIAGETPIPAEGARFDLAFEGSLEGERIKGTVKGVDYLDVRADGRFQMTIHATITTDDGARISFTEDGVVSPGPDGIAGLRLNMEFKTSHEKYKWLNALQGWGVGTSNTNTGVVNVTAFAPEA